MEKARVELLELVSKNICTVTVSGTQSTHPDEKQSAVY